MTGRRRRMLLLLVLAVGLYVSTYVILTVAANRRRALMQAVPYGPHPAQYQHCLAEMADTLLSWPPLVGLGGSILVAIALVKTADVAVGLARWWTTATEARRRMVIVIIMVAAIHLFVSIGMSLFLSVLEPAAAGLLDYRLPVSVQPLVPLFGWPIASNFPSLHVAGLPWMCGISACLSLWVLNSLVWATFLYAIWAIATSAWRRRRG